MKVTEFKNHNKGRTQRLERASFSIFGNLNFNRSQFISKFFLVFVSSEESYTVRLPVNVLSTAREGEGGKPFTKIGFVEFSSNATLSELRKKLEKDFSELLQGRAFLFQDAMMADVEPSSEYTTKSMYNLSVIIRFANHQGN